MTFVLIPTYSQRGDKIVLGGVVIERMQDEKNALSVQGKMTYVSGWMRVLIEVDDRSARTP